MKTQTELKELAAELTKFEASECSCRTCRELCEIVPCAATPQEIKALIDAGHIDDLAPTVHWASVKFGFPPLECVMIKARDEGGCSLLKAGKCTLHAKGLKPSEGKFANCKKHTESESFPHIAATWLLEENKPLVEWIMAQFPGSEHTKPISAEDRRFYEAVSVKFDVLKKMNVPPALLNAVIERVIYEHERMKEEKICDSLPVEA